MPTRFIYVDESYDDSKFCLSALAIRHSEWHESFRQLRNHRVDLKKNYGVLISKEIHARELVAGRGRLGPNTIDKWTRSRIYLGVLRLAAALPRAMLINVCLDKKAHSDPQMIAWDRLLNRVEKQMVVAEQDEIRKRRELVQIITDTLPESTVKDIESRLMMYDPQAVVISDEGREHEITRAIRRMHVYNPIPSRYGAWSGGATTNNITLEHLIEDPFFKESHRSFFLQVVDCIVFSLLKREVTPTKNIAKYGIDSMFDQTLTGICHRPASRQDPLGIVRK